MLLYVKLLKPFFGKALEITPQWTLPEHRMSQIAKGKNHHNKMLTAPFSMSRKHLLRLTQG